MSRASTDRAFPRPPLVLVVGGAVGALVFVVPLVALVVRAPWSDLADIVASRPAREALVLSLTTATVAAAISFVLGVPLAWLLARRRKLLSS